MFVKPLLYFEPVEPKAILRTARPLQLSLLVPLWIVVVFIPISALAEGSRPNYVPNGESQQKLEHLEHSKLLYTAGVTFILQDMSERSGEFNRRLVSSADLFLLTSAGPGELNVFVEGSTKPSGSASSLVGLANADAGTALNRHDQGRVQVSELFYSLPLGRTNWSVGLIDVTAFSDLLDVANDETSQFVATPLVNNIAIAFPDYSPALVAQWLRENEQNITIIVASSHGLADTEGRDYEDLFSFSRKIDGLNRGVFSLLEVDFPLLPDARVGGWFSSAEVSKFTEGKSHSRGGVFINADFEVAKNVVAGARFGWNTSNASQEVRTFSSIAVERQTLSGALGIGAAVTELSPDYRATLRSASHDTSPVQSYELYYRWDVGNYLAITPHLQYWANPSALDVPEQSDREVWIWGARIQATY